MGFRSPACAEESALPRVPFLGLVTGSGVNLRAGPGGTYEILTQLSKQSKIQVLAVMGEWYAVPLPEPVSAYVRRDHLAVEDAWGVARADRVHVRAGPGLGSSSFGFLSAGEKVRVRSIKGDWVEIQPPGFCRGWVHRLYVTFLEQESFPEGGSR